MKTQRIITISTAILGAIIIIGCSKHSVTSNDQLAAESYRQELPKFLKLKPEQLRVEAGAGFADVVIAGVTNDVERQRLSKAIANLNTQIPKKDTVRVKFE